jgi:TonB family protein
MKAIILAAMFALTFSLEATANTVGEKPKLSNKITNWVNDNLNYPHDALENKEEGTVYVAFTVKNGEVSDVEVVGGVSESLDKAALATIQSIPVAELGVDPNQNNMYILPIRFVLK